MGTRIDFNVIKLTHKNLRKGKGLKPLHMVPINL